MGSYNAVKAGVVAFSETAGHELAEYGRPLLGGVPVVLPDQADREHAGHRHGRRRGDRRRWSTGAPLGPDDIAAAVLEGIDRGDEVILPDDAARAAYGLKLADRAAYDAVMRKQAARLNAR